MADRLRDLIDLVVASLDEPADGPALAARAHFSRDHLDRLLAAATGESPVALRRRLLLERAAWQLRAGARPGEVAAAAGYGSAASFSRAFARAHGTSPARFAASGAPVRIAAPNGIHFHPPAGLLLPGGARAGDRPGGDLTERLVSHHLRRVRELLEIAAALEPAALARPLRPGFVVHEFEGEEADAATMAERLVYTLEVWVAAIEGRTPPEPASGPPLARIDGAARDFARLARRVRDTGAWEDSFVDALCEPPQSFTYGGAIAHVLYFGPVRAEVLAGVLRDLGAEVPSRDPAS